MYDNLKPGIYIQAGNEVKPLKNFGVLESILQGETENPRELAARVPYVYAALDRRKARIIEIEHEWTKGDQVTDKPPVQVRLKTMLQRTDEALQLVGAAYWYKLRDGRGKLTGFRWLDPRSMKPDENSIVNPIGFTNYIRTTSTGTINIPADDLVVFQEYGLAEYAPGGIAGVATAMAVEVLYNVQKAERVTYENPLPVSMVIVPQGTSEQSKNDLKGFIQRVFNRNPKSTPEYRVMPVYEGTSIERISLTPQELSFTDARDPNAQIVIAAHGVPMSEVFGVSGGLGNGESTGSSNDTRNFIRRIGSRLDYIAEELMYDDEFSALGWELKFYPDRHSEMQANEAETASAFTSYLQGFTAEAAAYLVGITQEDFPEGMVLFPTEPEPQVIIQEPQPTTTRAAWRDDLLKWRRKALRVNGWCEFESDTIPADLHEEISAALKAQKDEKSIKSLFSDYLDDEPETAQDSAIEKLLDGVIKALEADEPMPQMSQPVTQVFNLTVKGNEGATPEQIAAEFAKALQGIEPAQVTITNEVTTPVVNVTNEVQPADVVIKEATAPNVKVDVNLEQVTGMHTEYNRNRNGEITSSDTEVTNE